QPARGDGPVLGLHRLLDVVRHVRLLMVLRQLLRHPPTASLASRSAPANQPFVRLQAAHTDSMTGTSTRTPTTVASAAPEPGPTRRPTMGANRTSMMRSLTATCTSV